MRINFESGRNNGTTSHFGVTFWSKWDGGSETLETGASLSAPLSKSKECFYDPALASRFRKQKQALTSNAIKLSFRLRISLNRFLKKNKKKIAMLRETRVVLTRVAARWPTYPMRFCVS
jgi:hypothetical protein